MGSSVIGSSAGQANSLHLQLWVTNDWYIPVDADGFVVSESAEGALGFVIKLHSTRDPQSFQALKIPRLMGDTYRENAYIAELTEQELRAVRRVFGESDDASVTYGALLQANIVSDDLLRGPINTSRGTQDARLWNGSLVLVNFVKSKTPRFCLVMKDGGTLKSYPFENPPITLEQFEAIEQESSDKDRGYAFQKTVFVVVNRLRPLTSVNTSVALANSSHDSTSNVQGNASSLSNHEVFAADQALDLDPAGVTWYAGLPSVTYGWAPKTLQQSISTGIRGEWTAIEHLKLIGQICSGLRALHTKGMLHADVRPANIVIQGDAREPESYKLADYGSFAQPDGMDFSRPRPPGGPYPRLAGTQIGPVVVGERASAFYAPERRLGREREAADIAIIWNEQVDRRTIILGWKSDLLDPMTKLPDKAKIEEYVATARNITPRDESEGTVLDVGDRIQIRDYIFELVESEKRLRDMQIFDCKHTHWLIFHGRIAVESRENLGSLNAIPVPRTVELLKWSVSTDLYSLGALTLYSIFRYRPESEVSATASATADGVAGNDVEDQFREMLTYLTSVSFFNAIWPDLDWLRHCLEQELSKGGDEHEFTRAKFTRFDGSDDESSSLLDAAIEVTKRITQTTPGVQRLVEALNYNVAIFIFLFHFAFCCLHRESHLKRDRDAIVFESPDWAHSPFCKDRGEQPGPGENTPSARALRRLQDLQQVVKNPLLRQMQGDPNDIGKYDPQPEISVRIERDKLDTQQRQLVTVLGQAFKTIEQYEDIIGEFGEILDRPSVLQFSRMVQQMREILSDASLLPSVDDILVPETLRDLLPELQKDGESGDVDDAAGADLPEVQP